jgi:hypothetical protein
MQLTPTQKELAREIAEKMDDLKMLPYHEQLVTMYTEAYLRERLEYILDKPKERITNNRAAAYIDLVKNYPNFTYKNRPRH